MSCMPSSCPVTAGMVLLNACDWSCTCLDLSLAANSGETWRLLVILRTCLLSFICWNIYANLRKLKPGYNYRCPIECLPEAVGAVPDCAAPDPGGWSAFWCRPGSTPSSGLRSCRTTGPSFARSRRGIYHKDGRSWTESGTCGRKHCRTCRSEDSRQNTWGWGSWRDAGPGVALEGDRNYLRLSSVSGAPGLTASPPTRARTNGLLWNSESSRSEWSQSSCHWQSRRCGCKGCQRNLDNLAALWKCNCEIKWRIEMSFAIAFRSMIGEIENGSLNRPHIIHTNHRLMA